MVDPAAELLRVQQSRHKAEGEAAEQRYLDASKKRLFRIVSKKTTTAFIGALAKVEHHFGRLWGHGLRPDQKTPDQLAWAEVWEACRTEILNNGNNQQRALEAEFAQYTVRWDRYQTTLPAAESPPGVLSLPSKDPEEDR